MEGEPLKKITNKNYDVDIHKKLDEKLLFEFAKRKYFDGKASWGSKSTGDEILIGLLKLPDLMASWVAPRRPEESKTRRFQFDPKDLCERLKFLLQRSELKIFRIYLLQKILL